ncbi:MAG: DUF58 domain-containing protein [Planctomycetes bacterium]|nr:DUF58 domain-containing protein [Planctomycetota bacterium]
MNQPAVTSVRPGQAPSRGARSGSFIDPAALMRIRNLELRAKLVVDGFLSGLHKSPMRGFSVEFTEYRQYSPGDDLRYLDWRLFARSDRYYLKQFEDETNLRCYLLVDLSRSMGFTTLAYDKAEYARTAAATLAYFLSLQRDAVGLVTFDEAIREYMPARFRPGHLHRLMLLLERSLAGTGTDLHAPLEQVARTSRKRGLVILLSDLLAPADTLESKLGLLRSQGHEVVVLRILDPGEVDFTFSQESLFVDLESGRELYVDPQTVRREYQERFAAHARELETVFNDLGIDSYDLVTNRPLENVLFDLLNARLRRGRQVARGRSPSRRGGGRGAT